MFHATKIEAEAPVALEATQAMGPQARPPRRRLIWIGFGGAAAAASLLAFGWLAVRPACSCALPPINLKSFLDTEQTHLIAKQLAPTGSTLAHKDGANPHAVPRPGASLTRELAPAITHASSTVASAVSR